jgi:Fe-S-cluster containining protein
MRLGECKRCGFCCRHRFFRFCYTIRQEAIDYIESDQSKWDVLTRGFRFVLTPTNDVIIVVPHPCKYLGKGPGGAVCKLQSDKKPDICAVYPSSPEHDYFRVITRDLKVPCGYSFTEDSH